MRWVNGSVSLLAAAAVLTAGFAWKVQAEDDEIPAAARDEGCTFRSDPVEFLQSQSRARFGAFDRAAKLSRQGIRKAAVPADSISRRNFIDDAIFDKLIAAGVPSAPKSSDEEFVRRIFFDLTGRIPSAAEIREFNGNGSGNKREELIEKLLYSQEFSDKWAVWFLDLINSTEGLSVNGRRPQVEGRNALDVYIREAIHNRKPISEIVYETITATGNNYLMENGPVNFVVLSSAAMGPIQDTYDMMLSRTATSYLGLSHYDCLLCHNGRGHLESLSLWAQRSTRMQAQQMAAHFSRMRLAAAVPNTAQYLNPLYNSTVVSDADRGTYDLNVTFGNRPARCAPGAQVVNARCMPLDPKMPATLSLTPEYHDGSAPGNSNWRAAFAQKLLQDPMFGRNFANRLWKAFFNLGLVDPVDALDPARLDPANPPPSPWTLQATHPVLLEKLAAFFVENDTDIRAFIRLLVQSSAYQLSSQYSAPWKLEYVPLFARHYPRRLDAEEIHDAIVKSTGVLSSYTWPVINAQTVARGAVLPQSAPVNWAMKLPDINEPRANTGNARDFMASFTRGNRDTAPRSQSGTILQQLNLMNDQVVTTRVKVAVSPVLQGIAKIAENDTAVEEIFLSFLSRAPSRTERDIAVAYLAKAKTTAERNTFIEDLAWACINKIEFLFSY
jgi:hypothetical protein